LLLSPVYSCLVDLGIGVLWQLTLDFSSSGTLWGSRTRPGRSAGSPAAGSLTSRSTATGCFGSVTTIYTADDAAAAPSIAGTDATQVASAIDLGAFATAASIDAAAPAEIPAKVCAAIVRRNSAICSKRGQVLSSTCERSTKCANGTVPRGNPPRLLLRLPSSH
jgi:hypothetical protein